MTLQDLMMLYGVTLGKRRTAKQKYLFAQQLNESLPPLGWPVRVQQREGRFSKIENLIAGDLANAKVVIAVPFDTPAKALRPQKYYPFHPDKNVQQRGRDLALQCVLELLCFGAACLMFWSGRGTGAMLPRTLAALLPLWLYNGRRGYSNRVVQYGFYAFYPVHILILSLIALYV